MLSIRILQTIPMGYNFKILRLFEGEIGSFWSVLLSQDVFLTLTYYVFFWFYVTSNDHSVCSTLTVIL